MTDSPVLVPFKAEHLMEFWDRDSWSVANWESAFDKEHKGPAYTGMWNGKIIGCAGILLPWPGVGMAWVTMSPEAAKKFGIWMTRTCRHVLDDVSRSLHLHRLEAVVLEDNDTNIRWIELMGFVRENGHASKYLPDKRNVIRYERVR